MESSSALVPQKQIVLNSEIKFFAAQNKLTQRETDVFVLMLNQITTSVEISKHLGLSPNTVSNHLKSIITKTNSRSKTAVLAAFLGFCSERLNQLKLYSRKPKVMIVDDDPDFCQLVSYQLERRCIQTFYETSAEKAQQVLAELKVDSVVSDIVMPEFDGLVLLKKIRERHKVSPSFFLISGFDRHSRQECLEAGALEFFLKPFSFDKLAFVIMEQFIENPYVKNRFLRVDAQIPGQINKNENIAITNIGFGGMFVKFLDKKLHFKLGHKIDLAFSLVEDGKLINVKAKVSWRRDRPTACLEPGLGLAFTQVEEEDLNLIKDYVRTNKIFHAQDVFSGEF